MSDMEDPFRLVEAPAAGCRSEMGCRCEINTHCLPCALPSSHLTRCIPARTSIVESPRSSVHRPGARRGSLQRGSRTSAIAAIAVIRGLPLILAATKRGTARQALQLCPILERHKTYYFTRILETRYSTILVILGPKGHGEIHDLEMSIMRNQARMMGENCLSVAPGRNLGGAFPLWLRHLARKTRRAADGVPP